MNQEIHFKGLSLTPDDTHTQPGELSLCANAELHDGALRPSLMSATTITHEDGGASVVSHLKDTNNIIYRLLYVHSANGYTHYVAISVGNLAWFQTDGTFGKIIKDFSLGDVQSVTSLGNTLIIRVTDGIHYAKWNGRTYEYLGMKPPYLSLQFKLSEASEYPLPLTDTYEDIEFSGSNFTKDSQNRFYSVKEEYQGELTEKVMAIVNKIDNTLIEKDYFTKPFFVRYCYRLYDGTYYMHSAPILLTPIFPRTENVEIGSVWPWTYPMEDRTHQRITYIPRCYDLSVRMTEDVLSNLSKWEDLIESVDVFITPQLSRMDNTQVIKQTRSKSGGYYTYGSGLYPERLYPNEIVETTIDVTQTGPGGVYPNLPIDMPYLSDEKFIDKMYSTPFFRLYSYKLPSLPFTTSFQKVPVENNILKNIVTQEQMVDDYKTNNFINGNGMYVYNQRLNVFGVTEKLFDGFGLDSMIQYTNPDDPDAITITKVYVYIKTTEGTKIVKKEGSYTITKINVDFLPLFYPDSRAFKMRLYKSNGDYMEYPLTALSFFNGAVYWGSLALNYDAFPNSGSENYPTVDNKVDMLNKIYTSQVNNPYYFPLEGINTVGIGEILGVASTTRAISQGQFGQFPLMAFCTDGIWALEVSATGTYSSIHSISREVCANAFSICQLDQSVIFATKRGVAKIVSEDVASISNVLDGPLFNIVTKMPSLVDDTLVREVDGSGNLLYECTVSGVITVVYTNDEGETWIDERTSNVVTPDDEPMPKMLDTELTELLRITSQPFNLFVDEKTRVVYDFVNSRILFLSLDSNIKYAYVYSIRDNAWSTMYVGNFLAAVNGYPYPYLEYTDGSVLRLDKEYDYADIHTTDSLVLTRSLSYADTMQVIQGFQQINDSLIVPMLYIYGSNDNVNWRFVGKAQRNHAPYLPGTPFRWFRIAIRMKMAPKEKYSKLLLNVIEKYQKL